jgi:hypothetical protein
MMCVGVAFPLLNAWSLKQCVQSEFFEKEELQDSEFVDFRNSPLLFLKAVDLFTNGCLFELLSESSRFRSREWP